MLLYPVCNYLEKHKIPRILSIIISYVLVFVIFAGIIAFFSSQVINLFDDIKDFGKTLTKLLDKLIYFINHSILPANTNLQEIYKQGSGSLLESSTGIIRKTITSSTNFVAFVIFVIVYTFLFLLYRTAFKNFFLLFFKKQNKEYAYELLNSIPKVIQNYFYGMFIVIITVGTLNGIGMWIIGIDFPFLFGYLAAVLTIIPYIGTTIGGLLPTFYALVTYDNLWMPASVMVLYFSIQTIEGNILTPKIVGNKVSLNPLFALISLLVGGLLWGIAGMILFIPIMAIVKVIFDHIESLQHYGILLGSDFGSKEENLFTKINRKVSEILSKDESKK